MSASFPSLSQPSRPFPLPTIAEDALHYTLHLSASSSSTQPDSTALALLITEYIDSLLLDPWLWNKDGWELKIAGPDKLEGRMRVGDAVDDEWLAVWLLREVSRKWSDLVISIRDNDGEFLLIEAANELPSWVSPENADNRIWLQGAHLHLIPLSIRSASSSIPQQIPDDEDNERHFDPNSWLNEEDAVRAVRTGSHRADEKIEKAAWTRIECYPGAMTTHQHRTKAYLPERIARALHASPELVQRAIEGFYVRDPSQLRAASRMTYFPPKSSILTSILMTRAGYAQLQGQIFHPPRVFGPEWSVQEGAELDDERRWRELGVKISTGFEIMYREGGKKGRTGEADTTASTPETDPAYRTFIAKLKSAGYFGDEMEGSEKWKGREAEASKGWKAVRSSDTHSSKSQRPSFAFHVDTAIASTSEVPFSAIETSPSAREDSDAWLVVAPDELDGMMMRASGRNPSAVSDQGGEKLPAELGEEHGQALQDLARKVEQFVGGQGDVEGARFADELSDDGLDEEMSSEGDQEANAKSVLSAVEQDERMRTLVPALPVEEWGRKADKLETTVSTLAPSELTSIKPMARLPPDESAPKMRPPIFAKQSFDGVNSDSDEDSEDEILPLAGTLGRKIAEMKWSDGAPKIEEIDEEPNRKTKFGLGDDIDEQMRRRVWGDEDERDRDVPMEMNPDMGEEEEEFLRFSREALGISDDMWEGILRNRRERGAFVPKPVAIPVHDATVERAPSQALKKAASTLPGIAKSTTITTGPATSLDPGSVNLELDSFEKVMAAMDVELAKVKTNSPAAPVISGKSKFDSLSTLPVEADLDKMNEDDLAAMDRELRAALQGAGADEEGIDDIGELDVEEARELEGEDRREYKMMRDFLESYRSQAGGSGVVGNLFGRLGKGDEAES